MNIIIVADCIATNHKESIFGETCMYARKKCCLSSLILYTVDMSRHMHSEACASSM